MGTVVDAKQYCPGLRWWFTDIRVVRGTNERIRPMGLIGLMGLEEG
jgi:hypothetical protein